MKKFVVAVCICLLLCIAWLPCKAADKWHARKARNSAFDRRLLVKICVMMEDGRWGRLGGAGNMLESTWYDRTSDSYELSRWPETCFPTYEKHIDWILEQFSRKGIKPMAGDVYVAWRFGVNKAVSFRKESYRPECFQRAQNLYEDLWQ